MKTCAYTYPDGAACQQEVSWVVGRMRHDAPIYSCACHVGHVITTWEAREGKGDSYYAHQIAPPVPECGFHDGVIKCRSAAKWIIGEARDDFDAMHSCDFHVGLFIKHRGERHVHYVWPISPPKLGNV